jgi:hypothetical protein
VPTLGVVIPVVDYRAHPAYGGTLPKPTTFERARAIVAVAPHVLRASFDRLVRSRRPRTSLLGDDGVTTMQCDAEWLGELRRQIESAFGQLVEMAKPGDPMVNAHLTPQTHPQLVELVRAELARLGVLSTAAEYLGHEVSVQTIVLKVTDAASTFRSEIFADLGLPDPPARYFHVDSSAPRSVVKLLIYLSDVGAAQGPFTYVRGSHLYTDSIGRSIARRAVHKAKTLQECDPESRRRFYALPRFLQHKAEFGNDMTEPSDVAQLIDHEDQFCGPAGLLVLFDNSGVHRGGLVTHGHRSAIQVTLR